MSERKGPSPGGPHLDEPFRPSPSVVVESRRVVRIEILGNSTLDVARVDDGPEGPTLILSYGFTGGAERFKRPDHYGTPIRLPAWMLPHLVAALQALEG